MSAKKSHEQFVQEFKEKQPSLFSKIEILSKYENIDRCVIVKDCYGLLKAIPYELLQGKVPSIHSAINKTEYFKNKVKNVNPIFYSKIKILTNYTRSENKILIEDKFGKLLVIASEFYNKIEPTIECAVNPTEYFKKKLKVFQPKIFNNIIIIGKYKGSNKKIAIQNKYGICEVTPYHLLSGKLPTIESAINKTEYFINQAREIHGDRYDYSLVNYRNSQTNIDIICKKHNFIFKQLPNNHLQGKGCAICGREKTTLFSVENPVGWSYTSWDEVGKNSKNFKSYKIYIIKCFNETETFYKIGKTFSSVKRRFSGKKALPYDYEIIKEIPGDSLYISKLEKQLQKENKEFKYLPKLSFNGMNECFFYLSENTLNFKEQYLEI